VAARSRGDGPLPLLRRIALPRGHTDAHRTGVVQAIVRERIIPNHLTIVHEHLRGLPFGEWLGVPVNSRMVSMRIGIIRAPRRRAQLPSWCCARRVVCLARREYEPACREHGGAVVPARAVLDVARSFGGRTVHCAIAGCYTPASVSIGVQATGTRGAGTVGRTTRCLQPNANGGSSKQGELPREAPRDRCPTEARGRATEGSRSLAKVFGARSEWFPFRETRPSRKMGTLRSGYAQGRRAVTRKVRNRTIEP
jgi:hypothetical protein